MKQYRLYVVLMTLVIAGSLKAQSPLGDSGFKKTIYSSTLEAGNYTTLISALKATDLDLTLDGDAPFTIFAPSDRAFRKLSSDKIKHLLRPENKKELREMVTYFMVAGSLSASKILNALVRGNGNATFTTVQGKKINASIEGIDIILSDGQGNKAKITVADSDQCNGIIHTIDSVIMPKPL
ncbi:MAG: fasciclin domain-containing protein [Eudoraea sp.]|nr:fasciclin domain-containing protein [Eudoraea sp.]